MNTMPYAGFWKRFVAFILDSILAALPPALLCIPFLVWQIIAFDQAPQNEKAIHAAAIFGIYLFWQILGLVCMWLYFAFQESGPRQATLGKRLMKIKVVDKKGNRIRFAHASGRFFAKIPSYLTIYIGFMMAGLTNRKRALHDYIAETYVVRADFDCTQNFPDTPSHPWWLAFIIVCMISLFLLGLFINMILKQPAGIAFQAGARLQLLATQPTIEAADLSNEQISYYTSTDGYHAVFYDNAGNKYALYLSGPEANVCCDNYQSTDCAATGLDECW